MSLKKLKEKRTPQKTIFDKLHSKNIKIFLWSAASLVGLIILIFSFISYNEYSKNRDFMNFEKLSQAYNDILNTDKKDKLGEMIIKSQAMLDRTGTQIVKNLTSLYIGNMLMDSNDYMKSIKYYDDFIKSWNDPLLKSIARYNIGLSFEGQGHFDEAIKNYKNVIDLTPSEYLKKEANFSIARCYEKTGKIEMARTIYSDYKDSEQANYRLLMLN